MTLLKKAWRAWTSLAAAAGAALAWAALALLHFALVSPLALLYRALHRPRPSGASHWREPEALTTDLEAARRQD